MRRIDYRTMARLICSLMDGRTVMLERRVGGRRVEEAQEDGGERCQRRGAGWMRALWRDQGRLLGCVPAVSRPKQPRAYYYNTYIYSGTVYRLRQARV